MQVLLFVLQNSLKLSVLEHYPSDFDSTKCNVEHSGKLKVLSNMLHHLHSKTKEKIVLVSNYTQVHMYIHTYIHVSIVCVTLRVKITCPKSRVLLSRFAASITPIYYARVRTNVEDHGCTGQGKHATRTTTQRFSRHMPLLFLYHAPSFGCSSFFVHRGLCKNHSINVHGHTQCYT